MAKEQKTLEIQKLLLDAKNSSELKINQKYVESIQSKIIAYLIDVKAKGLKLQKLEIIQDFSVAKVGGEGYEQFKKVLDYVKSITFPETFSYDMQYNIIKIISPSQTVYFEIEFIERPGINSPITQCKEGAMPQSEINS